MFDKKVFELAFAKGIRRLQNSERVTREVLRELSRSVLEAVHATGDITTVNKLCDVLTPVNRKVCVLYFKAFSGFRWDDTAKVFTKKDKTKYAAKHAEALTFLEDPNNNLWSWAERHVQVEAKPFDVSKVTEYVSKVLKTAAGNGLSQVDVMRAILKAGIAPETIIACMDELGYDVAEEATAPKAAEPALF